MTDDANGAMAMSARFGLPAHPRVAILGDSVIAGLGVAPELSYARTVARELRAVDVMTAARTTQTVDQTLAQLPKVAQFAPDLILISVGGADGLVHPAKWIEQALDRFGPKSWGGVAGLEPRAVYSESSSMRRRRQKITSAVKVIVKRIGIRITGGYRRVEPDAFAQHLSALVDELKALGCLTVVIPPGVGEEKWFPGSNASIRIYRGHLQHVIDGWDTALFVDPNPVIRQWDDYLEDRLHLNVEGHRRLATLILETLERRARTDIGA